MIKNCIPYMMTEITRSSHKFKPMEFASGKADIIFKINDMKKGILRLSEKDSAMRMGTLRS